MKKSRQKEIEKTRRLKRAERNAQRVVREKKLKLRERLAMPVLDPALLKLGAPKSPRSLHQIEADILAFPAVDDAMKRSHRYYQMALGKVYAVWFELLAWDKADRDALLVKLNDAIEQKTRRGDGIHVLLRALIDYGGAGKGDMSDKEAKAVKQSAFWRVGRDAQALKLAARKHVNPDSFTEFVANYPGGIDRMARDETSARRGEGARVVKDPLPKVRFTWPKGLQEAVLDALEESEGVAIFLTAGDEKGEVKVVAAHDVNRSVGNWCDRLRDLDPLHPVSV